MHSTIVEALGLKMTDLWPDKPTTGAGNPSPGKSPPPKATPPNAKPQAANNEPQATPREVASWEYQDEAGKTVYATVRMEPGYGGKSKTFLQKKCVGEGVDSARPNGGKSWASHKGCMDGVRLVPYRLPQLVAAVANPTDPPTPLFVVEGEKCVDALTAIGLDATTSPMGAGKFGKVDLAAVAAAFTGRRVIILPDNDKPGWDHAADVRQRLKEIAGSASVVKLPTLPEKGDVADWLAAGGTREKLLELIDRPERPDDPPGDDEETETAPEPAGWKYEPWTTAEFLAADLAEEWLIEDVFVWGMPALIGGPKKGMKTSTLVDLVVSIATGTPFLGHFAVPRPRRVCLISGESGKAALRRTLLNVCRSRGIDPNIENLHWLFELPALGGQVDRDALTSGIKERGDEVVVIDPAYLSILKGAPARTRTENLFEFGSILADASNAITAGGATPVFAHHMRKLNQRFEPLDLDDLTQSGFAEFFRQWILLNRRERYDGQGLHRLFMSLGGSSGQSGEYEVDIDEGKLAADFSGRKWDVAVTGQVDLIGREQAARAEAEAAKQRAKEEKAQAELKAKFDAAKAKQEATKAKQEEAVLQAVGLLTGPNGEQAATLTQIRDGAGITKGAVPIVLALLVRDGRLDLVKFKKATGKGKKKQVEVIGYALPKVSDLVPPGTGSEC